MDPLMSMNEAFIVRLNGILEKNYKNEKFGVKELASEAGISRSNLHRKLHQINGLSASEFIMAFRLQKAYVLLKNEVSTVSEIAYAVGFKSPSYFSKCFQNQYHFSPGNVKNRAEVQAPLIPNIDLSKETSKNKSFFGNFLHLNNLARQNLKVYSFTVVIIVLLIALGVITTLNLRSGNDLQTTKSIAILPIEATSKLINEEILSEGMHQGLISSLGKIKGFNVLSRNTTLKYKDSQKSKDHIIRELGIDFLVAGKVNYSDKDSVFLDLTLHKMGSPESGLLKFTFNNSVENIISIQNEATKNIGLSSGVLLKPQKGLDQENTRKIDKLAYKNYIRGMYYLHKSTQEEFDKGIQYLYKALDADPAEPLVYAGLAYGYVILGHSSSENRDVFGMAKFAARKAIELDSTQLEAYAAMASINIYHDRKWKEAEELFDYLLMRNPSMANVHYDKAWYCMLIGDKVNAIKHHELAEKLDPFNSKYIAWSGWLYAYYGHYDKAMEKVETALQISPNNPVAYFTKGFIHQLKNDTARAMQAYAKVYELNPRMIGMYGAFSAKNGEIRKTYELIEEVKTWPKSPWKNWTLAVLYAGLNDTKEAVRMLNTEPKHAFVAWAAVVPAFDGIKHQDEFKSFVSSLNLPVRKEKTVGTLLK
ncbi:helix-turn-helix domain-containing protein [Echinicola jeungdonensis]|uniref:Helix-turn-helix domain-containing protein n=1 Tax=Echinicola jeungdonensis TaxID=709343 RepID=A0ABV5J7I0_9BACT|nr:helix-turn-helix domain-containing protein [Echinicola jeungdonensis]MDN3668077.1 helix-turn-helix domain-containing protein [Echinicola jeungdonensis]